MTLDDFPSAVLVAVREHARAEAPLEVCGFVLHPGPNGANEVLRARNVATRPSECFAADPKTSSEAWMRGITAVYHSHPTGSAQPSGMDARCCTAFGAAYLIYGVERDDFALVLPAPRLDGIEWSWGDADCFGTVRAYYSTVRGICLPDFERPPIDAFPPTGVRNPFAAYVEVCGFREVESSEPWKDGDVLAVAEASQNANHLGVVVGDQVLHHRIGELSRFEDLTHSWRRRVVSRYRLKA